MASSFVMAAVRARMGEFTELQVKFPNDDLTPPAGLAPYIQVEFPIARASQVTMGAVGERMFREEGAIRFVFHVDLKGGTADAETYADQIAAMFRGLRFDETGATVVTGEFVEVYAPGPLNRLGRDGAYHKSSFSVPYTYDFTA